MVNYYCYYKNSSNFCWTLIDIYGKMIWQGDYYDKLCWRRNKY